MVFQWRIIELLQKILQIFNILDTSMKDLHFDYFLHIFLHQNLMISL